MYVLLKKLLVNRLGTCVPFFFNTSPLRGKRRQTQVTDLYVYLIFNTEATHLIMLKDFTSSKAVLKFANL